MSAMHFLVKKDGVQWDRTSEFSGTGGLKLSMQDMISTAHGPKTDAMAAYDRELRRMGAALQDAINWRAKILREESDASVDIVLVDGPRSYD